MFLAFFLDCLQVPNLGPTNNRHYSKKFSHLSSVITGMCAPFFSNTILNMKLEVLMAVTIKDNYLLGCDSVRCKYMSF